MYWSGVPYGQNPPEMTGVKPGSAQSPPSLMTPQKTRLCVRALAESGDEKRLNARGAGLGF